jgi:branched-chain amino acid transport system substrate-binding protein
VLKVKQANADALFVYTNEEEAARALRELKKQGYDKPIVGETVLTSQKVIELGGDAANGAVAHVGLTADAPAPGIKEFAGKFQKEYNYKSDHNGMKATRRCTSSRPSPRRSARSTRRPSPMRCTAPSSR